MAKELTKLDKQIQEMVLMNYEQFEKLAGKEIITRIKIRLLCGEGYSYQQIGYKLNVTYKQARYGCDQCDTSKEDNKNATC